jgi:hypothetical protein
MKKILFLIFVLLSIKGNSENLDSTSYNKINVSICGGYSDIFGFLGTEINIKNFGLEVGWSKKMYTLTNFSEIRSVFGFGITYYMINFNKKGKLPYISVGYSINGSCEGVNKKIFWGDKMAFIIGYSISSYDIPLSTKIGFGYQATQYGNSPFALEIILIYKIFDI